MAELTHAAQRHQPLERRFWSKVDRREPGECWPWTGAKNPSGYGNFHLDGRTTTAHRVAYTLAVGPIAPSLEVDHVRDRGCSRTDCCNPAHLEAVTPVENKRRSNGLSARRAKQTHCIRGHEFTAENTYWHEGHRRCRACQPERRARAASAAIATVASGRIAGDHPEAD